LKKEFGVIWALTLNGKSTQCDLMLNMILRASNGVDFPF